MKAYIFFSVHEELFHRMAVQLHARGVESFSGFVWGTQQEKALAGNDVTYQPLVVFSRDLLPKANDGAKPDLEWLAKRERELGISIQRMLTAERHLLVDRSFEQQMRLAEVALREVENAYDRARPDFVFSEDVSCFHSYVHFAIARERGIPFWAIGTGRLPKRVSVYQDGPRGWERLLDRFRTLREIGLTVDQRGFAESYLTNFLERPARPTGMGARAVKPTVGRKDVGRFRGATQRYFGDPNDPTVIPPLQQIERRLVRMGRVAVADARRIFEKPVAGEKYVLYPIHFQPEATTLVQGPMYLDQVVLLRDIAASLPIGYRLYVKEHLSNRGRRPMSFYDAIKAIPSVRLLGPDEDTWQLIRNANIIAVITGTMGWEGLMFGKPVVTFGTVFFNAHPSVALAGAHSKDDWYQLLQKASFGHVSDREATLAMIVALHEVSYPGFIGNPSSFPEALEPENVRALTDALANTIGLTK
jgi:Capsule polysaccharide biosynthesis protein